MPLVINRRQAGGGAVHRMAVQSTGEGRLRRNDAAGSEPDLDQTASLITGCLWELAASPAPIAVLCL